MNNDILTYVFGAVPPVMVIILVGYIIKLRIDSRKAAEHYFKSLYKVLGKPYPEFVLSLDDQKFLADRNYNPEAIYHLIVLIMMHIKAPYTQFNVRVIDGTGKTFAGQYSHTAGLPTIEVMVRPYFTGDQVIAIVCHECMHHFLNVKKIKGRTESANEKLTDYAAVYTGFGKILQRGYRGIQNKIDGVDKVSKVGYISESDIKNARSVLRKYLRQK